MKLPSSRREASAAHKPNFHTQLMLAVPIQEAQRAAEAGTSRHQLCFWGWARLTCKHLKTLLRANLITETITVAAAIPKSVHTKDNFRGVYIS